MYSSIRSTNACEDLLLDTQNDETINIGEELQYSQNQETVEKCTERCGLTGNFVLDIVDKLSNKVLSDT